MVHEWTETQVKWTITGSEWTENQVEWTKTHSEWTVLTRQVKKVAQYSKKRLDNVSYPSVLIYSFSRTGPSFGANQNAVIIEPIKTINGA